LFEDPYRYSNQAREAAAIYADEHLEAARDMARKSIVLLKNERDLLPLATDVSLAIIGPLADSEADMIGSWSAAGEREDRPVTLLEGIRARVGEQVDLHFEEGASYRFGDEDDRSGFDAALAAAGRADVIIAAMGESAGMTGEAASRTSLELPGNQMALLRELRK